MTTRTLLIGVVSSLALAVFGASCGSDVDCGAGTVELDGVCVPDAECGAGTTLIEGECVPDGSVICETGTTFDATTGTCIADITGCGSGTVLVGGECVPEGGDIVADVTEPAEPNGLNDTDVPGELTLPAVGKDVIVGGCITPFEDVDADGETDPDLDAFLFEATGPTLLDVTVDGLRGLSGAFFVASGEPQLVADGWQRFGINRTSDTVQQQVFLPTAGAYALVFADSRSVLSGDLAFGTADTCYFATIANVAVPAPTAITTTQTGSLDAPQFYSFDPTADDNILSSALTAGGPASSGGLVVLRDGAYHASGAAPIAAFDLDSDTEVLLVVDPVFNFSLSDQPTSLAVTEITPVADPGDGTVHTLTHDAAQPVNYLSFDATAGDVVRVQFDPGLDSFDVTVQQPSARTIDIASLASAEEFVANVDADVCFDCASPSDLWFHVGDTGTYYFRVENLLADDAETYDVAFDRVADTPTAITIGTGETGDLTAGADRNFYLVDIAGTDWLDLAVSNFGGTMAEGLVTFYDRSGRGQLDNGLWIPSLDSDSSDGSTFGRITRDATGPTSLLVSVEDLDTHDGDETFEFDVTVKNFTAATVDAANPIDLDGETVTADSSTFYLVSTPTNGDALVVTTTGTGGFDPTLASLNRVEVPVLGPLDDTAGDGAESFAEIGPAAGFVALEVSGAGATGGSFDLDITAATPSSESGTSAPALAIPDDESGPVTDTLDIANACTILSASVDVDISHTFIGDLIIILTSPDGTDVLLQTDSLDGTENLVGNYPATLTPAESLGVLTTEGGAGTWTLSLEDTFAGDPGTLNSWGVNLSCL